MAKFTSPALFAAALSLNFFAQNPVYGQQQAPGVVTAVQGQAQLTRPALAQPTLLRQKDDIMLRDVVDTREKSMARMLFGGKATVTMRELSRFEVREETLPGGATRSTIQLNSGAILVNVARQLMKPGDEVIINTNNAVATIRGSMIYAESLEASQSSFAQLSGTATLNCPPPATTPAALTRFTAADIKGLGANCNLSPIRNITNEFAALLLRPFQLPRAVTREGNGSQIVSNGVAETGVLSDAAVVVTGGGNQLSPPTNSQPTNTTAPVTAGGGPLPAGKVNLPPPCRTC